MVFRNAVDRFLILGISLLIPVALNPSEIQAKHIHTHNCTRTTKLLKGINSKNFSELNNVMSNDMTGSGKITKKNAHHLRLYLGRIIPKLSVKQIMFLNNNYGLHYYYSDKAISKPNYRYLNRVIKQEKQHQKEAYKAKYAAKLKKLMNQGSTFYNNVQRRLIHDINNTRRHYGKKPLKISLDMQSTADYRTPKVQYAYEHYNDYLKYPHNESNPADNWIHGEDTHQSGWNYIKHKKYHICYWGANAGEWNYGPNTIYIDGTHYNNTTPQEIADNMNDCLMNHDNCGGNNNGHRDTELNSNYKYLGVGVSYNPFTNKGIINEQFSN